MQTKKIINKKYIKSKPTCRNHQASSIFQFRNGQRRT